MPAVAFAVAVTGASACGTDGSPPSTETEVLYAPAVAAPAPEPTRGSLEFQDVAREVGLDFWQENGAFGAKWLPETFGSGGGFFDLDGDQLPDVLLVNQTTWDGHEGERGKPTPSVFHNRGDGTFEDVTAEVGLDFPLLGMGVAFADYDADGDTDVYLTALGPNRLLRNDHGRFVDIPGALGTAGERWGEGEPAWSTAAAWVDVDRDGWVDLVVCNYVRWTSAVNLHHVYDGVTPGYGGPESYEGESCRLYANLEGHGFEDRTESSGVLRPEAKSLGIAVADFDDDGWPDLVIANDMARHSLFRNRGDGTFEDIAVQAGVAYSEDGLTRAGMGIDVGDLTGDGRLSIAIGNFTDEAVSLFTQIGGGLFQDRAGVARLRRPSLPSLTFGLAFADLDLDGNLDLALANGHIEPTVNAVEAAVTYRQAPQLFLGDGRRGFVDVSGDVGHDFKKEIVGRGLAVSDFDRDGDLDLLVTENGGPVHLFRNEMPAAARRFVRVRLVGLPPNLGALGAVVTLYTSEGRQRRMVRSGGSYLSESETNPVLFGLGSAPGADSVSVRWPTTGLTRTWGPVELGSTVVLRETAR
jgi:enediyne biosynthesis protein E4